jgi:polysaccharide biosynthesis transport protein
MKKGSDQGGRTVVRLGTEAPATRPVFDEVRIARHSGQPQPPVAAMVVAGVGAVGEEMRLLRAKVRSLDEEKPFRCFGIVSSAPGEGKSTVALGLAAAIAAERDRKVLVVDADLRKSALTEYLALVPGAGLSEWLEGTLEKPPLHRVEPPGFSVLTSGMPHNIQPELLGGERMEKLLEAARASFDVVVVDCPPLLPVADSVIMQDFLDGFLFVVRARHSPRETILKAVSHLKPGRVRGVVFNGYREVIPGYETYGHRTYGYR